VHSLQIATIQRASGRFVAQSAILSLRRIGAGPNWPHAISMLADFVARYREIIIARSQARVAGRACPRPTEVELENGIPVFLDQLTAALRRATRSDAIHEVHHEDIDATSTRYGGELLRMGLTIAQVVHDYGDVCQAITELAILHEASIGAGEFQTLNLCLDDAIAAAVTEFARQRERHILEEGTERLGILAHELRNSISTAMLSFESMKSGLVTVTGSTGLVHHRSLMKLRDLVDRSLAEVRLDAGIERLERIAVTELVEELEISAILQARPRNLHFSVTPIGPDVTIEGDRQIVAAALANLLQNAFKFTPAHGHVSLAARATADRVLFEIEDECGGLPPGKAEELFRPFEQRSADRTGVGLGLTICQRAAKANHGEIGVRDMPGKGCVFTLDLPRADTTLD
jgi:signal transduction histidine kinase